MRYSLSNKSIEMLKGVHPNLSKVVKLAIKITEQDFSVLCGSRTIEDQKKLYDQGRKTPGKIVTWTMKSKHIPGDDGFSHAVDLVPYPLDWSDSSKFNSIAKAMFLSAKSLGIKIRWGADWDSDGIFRERGETDSPHFELY